MHTQSHTVTHTRSHTRPGTSERRRAGQACRAGSRAPRPAGWSALLCPAPHQILGRENCAGREAGTARTVAVDVVEEAGRKGPRSGTGQEVAGPFKWRRAAPRSLEDRAVCGGFQPCEEGRQAWPGVHRLSEKGEAGGGWMLVDGARSDGGPHPGPGGRGRPAAGQKELVTRAAASFCGFTELGRERGVSWKERSGWRRGGGQAAEPGCCSGAGLDSH